MMRIKQLISMIYQDSSAVVSPVAAQDYGIVKRTKSIRKPVLKAKATASKRFRLFGEESEQVQDAVEEPQDSEPVEAQAEDDASEVLVEEEESLEHDEMIEDLTAVVEGVLAPSFLGGAKPEVVSVTFRPHEEKPEEPKIKVGDDIEVADEKDAEKKKGVFQARTHLEPGPCALDNPLIAWPGHRCDAIW